MPTPLHPQHVEDLHAAALRVRDAMRDVGEETLKRHLDQISPELAAALGVFRQTVDRLTVSPEAMQANRPFGRPNEGPHNAVEPIDPRTAPLDPAQHAAVQQAHDLAVARETGKPAPAPAKPAARPKGEEKLHQDAIRSQELGQAPLDNQDARHGDASRPVDPNPSTTERPARRGDEPLTQGGKPVPPNVTRQAKR